MCFGQAYAKLVLFLYGGSTLANGIGPVLLQLHCMAILFLAVNGITECYAAATMNVSELNRFVCNYLFIFMRNILLKKYVHSYIILFVLFRYNVEMVILSVIFLFISLLFSSFLGGIGFILANCCNFTVRIIQW